MNNLRAYFVPHPPLIIPEIGRGDEQAIKATIAAYQQVAKEIAAYKPDTIVIISPHALTYEDYFHIEGGLSSRGNFADYKAPQISFNVAHDVDYVKKLASFAKKTTFPAGTDGRANNPLDHATMIPLYFINQHYREYQVVRLSFSGLSFLTHYNYGKMIKEIIRSDATKKYAVIASGDLSHMLKSDGPYGYAEEGPLFDKAVCKVLKSGNFLDLFNLDPQMVEGAGECGFRSLLILAGTLDKLAVNAKLLSYEGPFGVGYAVASFEVIDSDEKRNYGAQHEEKEEKKLKLIRRKEDEYVSLARQTLELYVKTGQVLSIDKASDLLKRTRAGVFVSLKKHGMLRGCIGTIQPTTKSIAHEIIQNAISSGTEDPRFPPVSISELSDLVYSVDILKEPEPISSKNELDIKKYGVIVRCRGRSGLLLPNIEGVHSVEEQISIALSKAGISKHELYTLERFEVVRHQ
ncbi:MAG TPA: AmmeMemoRadiSam system protein A [Bacilli bacterium]|nr:AmmeMemoRadiSam system protein A [Bacilli bacterium]